MTWEMSELTYEVTGEHRGWMLINTETKRTIACESEAEARAIADAPLLLEEVKRLQKVEAIAEKRLEFIQRLMSENESMSSDLFWLTNTMDEGQQEDTAYLKQRAVHPSIADFVQSLAEWGFNHVDHGFLWEAMVSVIEAGERGDLDDLIEEQDSLLKAASNDEGEEE